MKKNEKVQRTPEEEKLLTELDEYLEKLHPYEKQLRKEEKKHLPLIHCGL